MKRYPTNLTNSQWRMLPHGGYREELIEHSWLNTWVVEKPSAWLKATEGSVKISNSKLTSEAMIQLSQINLMPNRIHK